MRFYVVMPKDKRWEVRKMSPDEFHFLRIKFPFQTLEGDGYDLEADALREAEWLNVNLETGVES